MITTSRSLALPALARLCLQTIAIAAIALAALPSPASAVTQSWNGYRWARTGPLLISLGDNLETNWSSLLAPAAAAWSAADNIDFTATAGKTTSAACAGVYGGVQVCNSNYGATGWLGYTYVWLSSGFIVQATVKLNDHYFAQKRYNTAAWRQATICHEFGHTLGLAHTNTSRSNLNTGSCMDPTNDPTGTAGTNGTLANLGPNDTDFNALNGIYANLDATQLPSTRLTLRIGDGYGIDGRDHDSLSFVPEPGSWLMLIAGFGSVGMAMRRRQHKIVCA